MRDLGRPSAFVEVATMEGCGPSTANDDGAKLALILSLPKTGRGKALRQTLENRLKGRRNGEGKDVVLWFWIEGGITARTSHRFFSAPLRKAIDDCIISKSGLFCWRTLRSRSLSS